MTTTKGISIDYGIKNFAFVKFHIDDNVKTIDSCSVIQFSKIKSKRMQELLNFFNTHIANVDIVLGEQQLCNNPIALEMSNCIQILCIQSKKIYKSVSARSKYTPDVKQLNYRQRKKYSVDQVDELLTNNNTSDLIISNEFIETLKLQKKKDDVSDCVLMCLWWFKSVSAVV